MPHAAAQRPQARGRCGWGECGPLECRPFAPTAGPRSVAPPDTPGRRTHLPRRLLVAASMPAGPQGGPQARASAVPTPDEDKEVMHQAFLSAYGQSHHGPHISGMQEFAGAVSCQQGETWWRTVVR